MTQTLPEASDVMSDSDVSAFPDEDYPGLEDAEFADLDDGFGFTEADCGRWINGKLTHSCTLAGSEDCDWECPLRGSL